MECGSDLEGLKSVSCKTQKKKTKSTRLSVHIKSTHYQYDN